MARTASGPKAAARKVAAKKAAAKKSAPKAAVKKAALKAPARKKAAAPAPKKAARGKAATPKKTAPKKTAAKKAAPKKPAAVKKPAPKKAAPVKAAVKKSAARVPATRPTPVRRARPAVPARRKAARPVKKPAAPQKFTVSHLNEADFKADGLRAYALYRDLGIAAATGGLCQAHVLRLLSPCTDEVRKRHLHECELQLVYVLKGWVKNEFEGHGEQMMSTGSCWLQPAGVKHTVLDYSPDVELLEIVVPADFKTVELT